jgi:(1->4)-alpha-D-glucan 1-alpha-D-glucosylmutase
MIPRATYRLQFHKGFTFDHAAALAPYFAALGVSHIYASPILTARAGSMHGYDVVDHTRINPELGGEAGFLRLVSALRAHGLGVILDIVPNHMAVGGGDNRLWLDVLRNGRASDHAGFFDIDFDTPEPGLTGKVLAPFLGGPYGEVLRSGDLKVAWDADHAEFSVFYHDHRFPIRPEDQAEVAGDPAGLADPDRLHALLERQNFRLAWWRTAADQINWRRFFDIIELAGLRVERPEVFDTVHAVTFDLYARGLIDGVRVDHVDGLADPAAYCRRLRERLEALSERRPADAAPGPAYIVVEKILGPGEDLPSTWNVDGTSGYDFMNLVSAVQHDQGGEAELTALWTSLTGRSADFDAEERPARDEILLSAFGGQLERAAQAFHELALADRETRDFTRAALRRSLTGLIRGLRVYRTYATGLPDSPPPGVAFERAVESAKGDAPAESAAVDFIDAVMRSGSSGDAVRRLNQLTAPVTAKAVEDTAFYRYGRLLSRNDVGFQPALLAMPVADFHHAVTRRAAIHPHAMLTTASHDHKRGEDVRARLAVLSELPGEWRRTVESWFACNAGPRPSGLAPDDEYQLYQTLVGAWPLDLAADDSEGLSSFGERVAHWQEKSLREAKLRSSWTSPDAAYEAACRGFLMALLNPTRSAVFLAAITAFVDRIAPAGALNGLVQMVLRTLLPGVPDLYQGNEFWDFSLVDPDNRRPVDYVLREAALTEGGNPGDVESTWRDGRIKQRLLKVLLALRAADPAFFEMADYQPVEIDSPDGGDILAFSRSLGERRLLVAAPLHRATIVAGSDGMIAGHADWLARLPAIFADPAGGGFTTIADLPAMILFKGSLPISLSHGKGAVLWDVSSAMAR